MLATTFSLIALVASANNVAPLTWQTDYAKAYAMSVEKHRPMALFIGEGTSGPAQIVKDGLTESTTKLLKQNFVVVYINTKTASGKKLAESYHITSGLVISDRSGEIQALRLAGTIEADDFAASLVKYSDPNVVVTTTQVSAKPAPVAVYAPSPCASGNCPYAR